MTTTTIRPTFASQAPFGMVTPLRALVSFLRRRTARRELNGLTLEQLRDVGIDPDVISRGHELPADPWTMSRLMSLR